MLRMSVSTKLSPEEVTKRAIAFFKDSQGLSLREQSPTCAYFEGAGGTVDVVSCTNDKGTSVELLSTEWDIQVKRFADKLS